MRRWLVALVLAGLAVSVSGCVSVKPYQRMKLNDEDMQLSPEPLEQYEDYYQTYREGASGGNAGKVGGGCGCN